MFSSFKNSLSKDLNKIAKKLPLPPMLTAKTRNKEFNRDKFLKVLEKKHKYFSKLIHELDDFYKLEKLKVLLASLSLLLQNKESVNDDEILEIYSQIKKGY